MKHFNLIAIICGLLIIFNPNPALAEVGGLTKCSDSPAFAKRQKTSVKKLEQRMATYQVDSPPALALQQQIDRTNARFDRHD